MRGIILAAGKGSRLNGTIGDKPKCLLRVGGRTLVERQIDALQTVGIDDIAIVVGCQADHVRRVCGPGVAYIENTRYAQTNSLYSLWMARPLLNDGFVVRQAQLFADRVAREGGDRARQIDLAYRIALTRPPAPAELALAAETMRSGQLVDLTHVLFNLNEFVYIR